MSGPRVRADASIVALCAAMDASGPPGLSDPDAGLNPHTLATERLPFALSDAVRFVEVRALGTRIRP